MFLHKKGRKNSLKHLIGYARLDFRVDNHQTIYFIEINFQCSVFYPEGYEGSADYILKYDGTGQAGFLNQIISEGIERHQRRQKKYKIGGNAIYGYGSYAVKNIVSGELIWQGEEKSQCFVTRSHVESYWTAQEVETFRRYAYPISEEVFRLWHENPNEWMPHNHSCNPNMVLQGLNFYATREIKAGEELTLDYTTACNEEMLSFACQCGAPNCRGMIYGTPGNSVTYRELKKRVLL